MDRIALANVFSEPEFRRFFHDPHFHQGRGWRNNIAKSHFLRSTLAP